jgi:hypothetical protein
MSATLILSTSFVIDRLVDHIWKITSIISTRDMLARQALIASTVPLQATFAGCPNRAGRCRIELLGGVGADEVTVSGRVVDLSQASATFL